MSALNALEGPIVLIREATVRLLNEIALAIPGDDENAQTDRQRLREIARDLRELFFMVTVIGEFNAGKSSFVNALMGEPLLPTGVLPTTEHIELVRYGEEVSRIPSVRDDGLREWTHPAVGRAGVAIVDTPGTGSIFQRHESTAKSFLHRSDLVIFVILGKQAFGDAERQYMKLALEYGKRVILVINQIDQLTPSEQSEVRRFVESKVNELLGIEPPIFMVSAKEALAGGPNSEAGGVSAVRAYLRGIYNEAPPAQQKLRAQLDTAERILEQARTEARRRVDLVGGNLTQVETIQQELEQKSLGLVGQMAEAQASILTSLEGIRQRGISFIEEHLSLKRLTRSTDRDVLQKEFQDFVIGQALRDVNEATTRYINAVIDQSRLYWRNMIERLTTLSAMLEQEDNSIDASIYAEQRSNLQEAIRIAEAELKTYSSGNIVLEMENMFKANVGSLRNMALMSGSGIIAAIIAIATPGGIAAFPLVLPALVLGSTVALVFGWPAVSYFRRINREAKDDFNKRVDTLIANYRQGLDALTSSERARLSQYGKQIIAPILARLEVVAKRYETQYQALETQKKAAAALREKIQSL